MPRGKYVVIEGNDGTGKSTQVKLLRKRLTQEGIESVEFHEPAGTPIADAIRDVIKNGDLLRAPETNLLLFTAARYEIWRKAEGILQSGTWVISARNYFSTLAYQGYAEKLDLDLIQKTTKTFTSEKYMHPDFAAILDLDLGTRKKRLRDRDEKHLRDTFERRNEDFQMRINEAYRIISESYGEIPLIDASATPADVSDAIWTHVKKLL